MDVGDDRAAWRAWLKANHKAAKEAWLVRPLAASGRPSLAYGAAVEEALCFGWIDSISRSLDERRYRVRFTPRRRGSVWSAVNVAKIAELTERGLMRPAGLRAFEQRKPDRVAVYSYEQPDGVALEEGQAARLRADPRAWEWFSAQTPSYRRSAVHWVVSAKRADTRERRLAQLISDSAAGRKVPPLVPR